jgi:hypothetical protein
MCGAVLQVFVAAAVVVVSEEYRHRQHQQQHKQQQQPEQQQQPGHVVHTAPGPSWQHVRCLLTPTMRITGTASDQNHPFLQEERSSWAFRVALDSPPSDNPADSSSTRLSSRMQLLALHGVLNGVRGHKQLTYVL